MYFDLKTAQGSLTITESDEAFNEQTDLDSEHGSLKTVDKQQLSDKRKTEFYYSSLSRTTLLYASFSKGLWT